MTRQILWTR